MRIQLCAICEKNAYRILYPANFSKSQLTANTFSARRIPDRIHYRIVQCKYCGLVYSNPILDLEELNILYLRSAYTYEKYESDLIATYGKYFKNFISLTPSKKWFLEIGCGNGFFLSYAKSIGFKNVLGVEPGKETVKQASSDIRKKIIRDIFKKNQFKANTFDVICFFQVFDHIPKPNEFLKECYKILKPHGLILAINHNADSFTAKILKERSPIIDIEHTYLFSKKTLGEIFIKHGFEVKNVFDVANRYPLSYWLRMAPLPMHMKRIVEQLLISARMQDKKIWLRAGNIGIAAMK